LTGIVASAAAAGAASVEGVRALLRIRLPPDAIGGRTVLQAAAASGPFLALPASLGEKFQSTVSLVLSSGQVMQFAIPVSGSGESVKLVAESSLASLAHKDSHTPQVRLLDSRSNPAAVGVDHSSQSAVAKSASAAAPAS
jgi:hypothetical protein